MKESSNSPENPLLETPSVPQPEVVDNVGAQEPVYEGPGEENMTQDFSMMQTGEGFPQTTHSSNLNRNDKGSVQVLVLFFLASFSICSAMLNLYLFWQARNLGAEIERLKPPSKSGLAPRH